MLGSNFASCWLKLKRAEEHSATLYREIGAWRDSSPYIVVKNRERDGSRHSVSVQVVRQPDVDSWSLIGADCIHNLRAALDQSVYAIAVHESKSEPPPKADSLAFPICDDSALFEKKRWRIKSLSKKSQRVIEELQPYNRIHATLPPLLSIVRDFDDSDKHRLLQIATAALRRGKFEDIRCKRGSKIEFTWSMGTVTNGAEVAAFTINPPHPNLKYKYEAHIEIAVTHAAGPTGASQIELALLLKFLGAEVVFALNTIGSAMS